MPSTVPPSAEGAAFTFYIYRYLFSDLLTSSVPNTISKTLPGVLYISKNIFFWSIDNTLSQFQFSQFQNLCPFSKTINKFTMKISLLCLSALSLVSGDNVRRLSFEAVAGYAPGSQVRFQLSFLNLRFPRAHSVSSITKYNDGKYAGH